MFESLFSTAGIPAGKAILAHVRLSSIHQQTGVDYAGLSADLLARLLECKPSLLVIPAFTIYSFMSSRIFHLHYTRSEVGRFSEEIRQQGYARTPDPMYSLLDILGNLPTTLDYQRSFGPGTVFDFLRKQNAVILNIDMPGFYATPVHCVELEQQVPYRYEITYDGKMQLGDSPWQEVHYNAYVRAVDRYGAGSYPPYNQQRRLDYLRGRGIIRETSSPWGQLAWGCLDDFCPAIAEALAQDPYFLVDQAG